MGRVKFFEKVIFFYCITCYLVLTALSLELDQSGVIICFGLLQAALFVKFIYKLGNSFPFIDLIPLLAVALWVLVPVYSYKSEGSILFHYPWLHMPVSSEEYFRNTVPGVLLLVAGLYLPIKSTVFNLKEWKKSFVKESKIDEVGIYLISVGVLATAFGASFPTPLLFIGYLLSTLLFTGTFYMLFSDNKLRYFAIVLYFLFPVRESIHQGMFGEVIFWAIFFVVVGMTYFQFSFPTKAAIVVLGFTGLIFVQALKIEYREAYWYETGEFAGLSGNTIMLKVIERAFNNTSEVFNDEKVVTFFDRFNQGKQIAYCYAHVPHFEPFARGEPILTATLASVVPRFLWPDKPTAGGRDNYLKFTGRNLVGKTSMNISPLGDGYVNFGPFGASLFLFAYGVLFNFLNKKLLEIARRNPTLVFWFPFFWLYVVQVETDFVGVLNHAVKTLIFTWVMLLAINKIFATKL